MNPPIPTEFQESVTFAEYLTAKKYLFSHIPSETYTKFWGVRMKNKRMGVHKGVPDYIVIVKDKLVFIEMKRRKGGVISDEQRTWIEALMKTGNHCFISRGAEEAIRDIECIAKS